MLVSLIKWCGVSSNILLVPFDFTQYIGTCISAYTKGYALN